MGFGVHGPHDFRAVGILNHVVPEENPVADAGTTNTDGEVALAGKTKFGRVR
jgi:hypothetical protein